MIISKSSRTVKAGFDESLKATAYGGLALAERAATRTGLWRILGGKLPERYRVSGYDFVSGFAGTAYGLLAGGRGFSAGELIRDDEVAKRMLGLEQGLPADCSVHRLMCDAADIPWRKQEDWYEPDKDRYQHKERGRERKFVRGRRKVAEEEEWADKEMMDAFAASLEEWLPKLILATPKRAMQWGQWIPVFGDATQLEVTGQCFEGAVTDHKGNVSLQWLVNYLGPYLSAQSLHPGSNHEATDMPSLVEQTARVAQTAGVEARRILALMDSAYGCKSALEALHKTGWHYIVGANDLRLPLEKKAREMPQHLWQAGIHPEPKFSDVAYCSFFYQAATWDQKELVVALRYRKPDELFFSYQFVFTNLEKNTVEGDRKRLGTKTLEETIFMMYHHKQGRENGFKNPLRDMHLHHPPSGRFGANQVFYAVASMAVNLYVAVSRAGVPKKDRGIRLSTMRVRYFNIAATVAVSARQTTVRLSTAIGEKRRNRWLVAFNRIKNW